MLAATSIVLVLIVVNALYVAAEFSVVSVRRSRIQQHAEDGSVLARRLLPFVDDANRLDRYIAACQIGITLSSLVLGAYAHAALAPRIEPLFERLGGMQATAAASASATLVLVGLTALQVILGELVPKSLALQFPTAVALYTVVPMQWSLRGLAWFIALLNGSGTAILRLLKVRISGHRHIHSPQELDYLIAESRDGGLLQAGEHHRLRQALKLRLRRVEHVMVPRISIHGFDVNTPVTDALERAVASPFTRFPVYEGSLDHVLGMVHVMDLARTRPNGRPTQLRDLMRTLPIIPDSITAERALGQLRAARHHMALVVDAFGGTAGIVTIGDLLHEIFGGIADEFKPEHPTPQTLPDGRVRLPGSLPIENASQWVGTPWQGVSLTVGGLIMERLGRIPGVGDRLSIGGALVEVERVTGHAVESILVVPLEPGRPERNA